MRRLILSVLGALALLLGFAAPAMAATGPTFTVDRNGTSLADYAALNWERGTSVNIELGSCDGGPGCIELTEGDFTFCDGVSYACWSIQPDGSCLVVISSNLVNWLSDRRAYVQQAVGGCMGLPRGSHPGSIMARWPLGSPPPGPSPYDRRNLSRLY